MFKNSNNFVLKNFSIKKGLKNPVKILALKNSNKLC